MDFRQIQDFFIVLMAILGFISILGGVINLFRNWKKESPHKKIEDILKNHEKRITNNERIIKEIENDLKETNFSNDVLFKSILAIISHEINGNSKDKLEKAKDELEEYLIKRKES